jgi:hypothetical protein
VTHCGRCGAEDRPDRFVFRLVDLEAEAREDGRHHDGPVYGRGDRCRDRQACRDRARRQPQLEEAW